MDTHLPARPAPTSRQASLENIPTPALVLDRARLDRNLERLLVAEVSQEHGILAIRSGSDQSLPPLPVEARVRILPIHACATAAQHDGYNVVSGESAAIEAYWPGLRGS